MMSGIFFPKICWCWAALIWKFMTLHLAAAYAQQDAFIKLIYRQEVV